MKKTVCSFMLLSIIILCSSCSAITKSISNVSMVIPEYLSDCDAQFNETDNQFLVSFGLKDSKEKYIATNGTAKVLLTDKKNNKLFEKTINFDEKDFSDYTSKQWEGSRYLCGLYINSKDITPAATNEGIVELSVSAADKQAVFKTQRISVFGLPTKDINIKKPKLPKKISYIDFDKKETVVSISDIVLKTDILIDKAYVEAKVSVKMIKNNLDKDDDFEIKCVLKDSKGVQVANEEMYCEYIKNGESEYVDVLFDELDANEEYKLSFVSVDDSY